MSSPRYRVSKGNTPRASFQCHFVLRSGRQSRVSTALVSSKVDFYRSACGPDVIIIMDESRWRKGMACSTRGKTDFVISERDFGKTLDKKGTA